MGLSTHGVSGDGCVDNHDCFPHVYPHVFHSFQGVIHMLTGGMGMVGWRRLDRRGIDGIKGERWELGEREGGDWEHNGERGGHREERGGGDWGFYAIWGAYMGHVGGSGSIYGRLMQCMSGWRRKGRRMRGLGGE